MEDDIQEKLEEIYTFLDYNQSIIYNVRANYETIDIYNGDEGIEINLVSPYDKDELKILKAFCEIGD